MRPVTEPRLDDPTAFVRTHAPWLLAPELGTCLVGSQALAIACARRGVEGPRPKDLDLAWALDVDRGRSVLQQHGAFVPTTTGNESRGTLAVRIGLLRCEITTLRAGEPTMSLGERIRCDLAARDMTCGAAAVLLATGEVFDPHGGVDDWIARRVVPVGDPKDRVREHPVRWLRWFRKASEWGFALDASIRKLDLEPSVLDSLPQEAVAGELRAGLLQCASPGRFFVELFEHGLLQHLLPELSLQFDGRLAGPQRWHPELSQGLHLVLSLEWATEQSKALDERDRLAVLVAVLCHDLGKGYSREQDWPSHPGHEHAGLAPLARMLDRFPGFADQRCRTLAMRVCELHLLVRRLSDLRAGTLAEMYDRHFRAKDPPLELFALAVAADVAGRLGCAHEGEPTRLRVLADLQRLRAACESVDAAALRAQFAETERFKQALHEARARAVAAAWR